MSLLSEFRKKRRLAGWAPPFVALFSCALAACTQVQADAKPTAATKTAVAAENPLPPSVHWYRDSAEQKAAYLETYRAASRAARELSVGLAPQSWGVILDVDETVLDNSDYQKRLAVTGAQYDPKTWDAWVREEKATPLPGAISFTDYVRDDLHGKVVLVTNRLQSQCAATEENLRSQKVHYDRILCNASSGRDKNPRFRAVIEGDADHPPVNVLVWVGDNIEDFPGLNQDATAGFAMFGTSYFVLPNPLYGSWEAVPPR